MGVLYLGFRRMRVMTFRRTRCAHCKGKLDMSVPNAGLHSTCESEWVTAQLAKQERAKTKQARDAAKVERANTRARKEAMKRIPDLIKEAQHAFNAYIRERDKARTCICCGLGLRGLSGSTGGDFDCGHYRSVGSAPQLRFDERNAHGQRKVCNRWGAGRAVDYRIGLIGRIGVDAVDELEASNTPHKWQRDELIAIKQTYRAKLRELKDRA